MEIHDKFACVKCVTSVVEALEGFQDFESPVAETFKKLDVLLDSLRFPVPLDVSNISARLDAVSTVGHGSWRNEEKPEWNFDVPPSRVDLKSIWEQLLYDVPDVVAHTYLAELREKAPQTYGRLREWRLSEQCQKFNWNERPLTLN